MNSPILVVDLHSDCILQVPDEVDLTNDVAIAKLLGLDAAEFFLRQQHGEIFVGPLAKVWRHVLYRRPAIRFKVVGSSMVPTLVAGERVSVQPVIEPLKVGEIVLAEVDGRLVIHRVIAVDASWVVLRGDNSPKPDQPIRINQVVGIVVAKELRFRPRMAALHSCLRCRQWRRIWPVLRGIWTGNLLTNSL